MVGADEFNPAQSAFEVEVSSGDERRALVALRDLLAHELSGNRCKACRMSQMRTGDLAALALRLQKVIEDLKKLGAQGDVENPLDEIRARRERKSGGTA